MFLYIASLSAYAWRDLHIRIHVFSPLLDITRMYIYVVNTFVQGLCICKLGVLSSSYSITI